MAKEKKNETNNMLKPVAGKGEVLFFCGLLESYDCITEKYSKHNKGVKITNRVQSGLGDATKCCCIKKKSTCQFQPLFLSPTHQCFVILCSP